MGIELTAQEVFRMAEQIERDAGAFYSRAAEHATDPVCRRLLRQLADMEDEHLNLFSTIKDHPTIARVTPQGLEATGLAAERWPAAAGMLADIAHEHLAEKFPKGQTNDDLLRKAIEFEKDTIVFFLGLRTILAEGEDRSRVDEILLEELGHVLTLTSQLITRVSSPADGKPAH